MNSHYTKGLPISIVVLGVLFVVLITVFNLSYPGHNHFSLLAQAFTDGRVFFTESSYSLLVDDNFMHDAAVYNGQYFWPLGPLPGVLMVPFLLVSWHQATPTPEGVVNLSVMVGIIITLFNILVRWFASVRDRVVLILAFVAGSPLLYIALIPKSWFVSHSVTVLCLLLALREYYANPSRKAGPRYWFMGALFALAFATRASAVLGIVFVIFMILQERGDTIRTRLNKLILLILPVLLVGGMLGVYNFIRFDSFLEQGYQYQIVAHNLTRQRSIGLFSHEHIPTNLYYFLLAPPRISATRLLANTVRVPVPYPDPWGMSIVITSPYLLYLVVAASTRHRSFLLSSRALLVASGITIIPLLMYYGIGYYQFGYRYALDFFPLLFLAFVTEYQRSHATLSRGMTILITISSLTNLYFVLMLFCTKPICL